MEVDKPFAEYVAARWSMLYRLAVLLVGPDDADAVAQQALARAYASWHDVEEAPSTDARVKEILAKAAVSEPAGVVVPAGPDPWSRLGALPRGQRAILVLRAYEYLSDPEIARILGCRADEVEADASAGLAGVGVSAADLGGTLVRTAEEVDVPLPPLAELLARGREEHRRRRRRSWRWAAGAAAVVVVGAAVTSVVQGAMSEAPSAPASAEPLPELISVLPSGKPPRLAYSVGDSLHLANGRQVELTDVPSALVQTKKWLFVGYTSAAIVRVDVATGESHVLVSSLRGDVVTDPAGEHLAWARDGDGPAVVVLQTVADGAVLIDDQQQFPEETRCCANLFVVNGITQDGTVVASLPAERRVWAWTTPDAGDDSAVREISGLGNGIVHQVTATEIAAQYGASHFAVGQLVDGDFLVGYELNAKMADFADPRGRRVLYVDNLGEFHVADRPTRDQEGAPDDVRLRLPALDDGYAAVRWEDDDHVLLDVSDSSQPGGALVRCDVDSGACETAVRFVGPHLVAR